MHPESRIRVYEPELQTFAAIHSLPIEDFEGGVVGVKGKVFHLLVQYFEKDWQLSPGDAIDLMFKIEQNLRAHWAKGDIFAALIHSQSRYQWAMTGTRGRVLKDIFALPGISFFRGFSLRWDGR
jgi:hypothetical protein